MADTDQRYEALLRAMADLVAALRSLNEAHWAEWVEQDRRRIENGDGYGIEHFLSAFGGMGSLNDVRLDGSFGRTGEMMSRCYDLAREIRRELDRRAP